MSIRNVARTCQVSPMTVSLVLNNPDTGRVSPETRSRVLKAVRDLGYRPKPRTVESEQTKTLGFVATVEADMFSGDHYAGRILQGIIQQPGTRQNNIMMFAAELLGRKDIHSAVRAYCDGRCDALVMVAPNKNSPLARALILRGLPLVIVGTSEPFDDLEGEAPPAVVDIDNHATGREAVAHLVSLGHRRIGFIGGVDFVVSTHQRRAGYEEAMASFGLPIDPRWVREEIVKVIRAPAIVAEILALPQAERPTALFCWNDGVAHDALRILKEHGIAVPGEMSVLGIDDSAGALTSDPPLTTFRQPFDLMGKLTIASLQRQFDFSLGEVSTSERHLLPAELIVRGSTAPPPSRS